MVSQTSTADATRKKLIVPAGGGAALCSRLWRVYAAGALAWLVQAAPVLLYPGLDAGEHIRPEPVLVSLTATAILCFVFGLRIDVAGPIRARVGALVGLALACAHLLLLMGLSGTVPSLSAGWPDPGWAMLSLAVAAVTGATLAWCRGLIDNRWGQICAVLCGVLGLAHMHITAMTAIDGIVRLDWVAASGGLWFGQLSLLLGARLGDMSMLASRRSLAERERFRLIAEALPIPIVLTGPDNRRVLFTNRRSQAQFCGPQSGVAAGWTDSFYVQPADQQRLLDVVNRDGAVENYEVEMRRGDGSTFWALVSARSIAFAGESADGGQAILTSYHDITDRKVAEEALLASEVRYALISRAANDGIWDWDIPSGTVYYSTRWKEIAGIAAGARISTLNDWLSRVHPDDVERLRNGIDAHIAGATPQLDCEYRILHGDGRYCWMQCRAIALHNKQGEPIRMAGSQSDVTLRKTYEINLLNAAYEDRLTGINNRAFFSQLVDSRNSVAAIDGTAILLLNIDQFRRLNDSLGTAAGDAMLIAMARRLAARVKPVDALSRIGNDEFTVWVQEAGGHAEAYALAETLLADLSQPYALGDVEMSIAVSIGLATPTLGDAESGADLLRNARLALDRAKQLGGGRVEMFDDALLRETHLKRRLSKDLTSAERAGQIFFEYQPVVSLDAGGINRIIGFEMLMRWRHPELGLIEPARFIPIAEEAGLIGQLGLFAIECAAGEIADLTKLGLMPDEFSIAVNLSNRQISNRAGILRMHALLDRLAVPRGRLKLEITESVLMNDPEAMATTLQEFKQRGLDLALDDFGTGYSSLSYLHRFPLDVLKIDRSFVSRMVRAPEALRLVRSIIELSHDLGLKVVAEGVEAAEESDLLRELRCDHAQGYYYSRPVSSEQARALLAHRVIRSGQVS
jgi:diguanylate cyclase (GGDEF)-like protein/PAS domain S-box-containing protein